MKHDSSDIDVVEGVLLFIGLGAWMALIYTWTLLLGAGQ